MNLIITMFQYPFIQRALIVGVLVSLCAALLGVCLVLKHYSMIGDGLSHVSFGALSVAVALGVSPLWISIPIVIIASFCLLRQPDKITSQTVAGKSFCELVCCGRYPITWFEISFP